MGRGPPSRHLHRQIRSRRLAKPVGAAIRCRGGRVRDQDVRFPIGPRERVLFWRALGMLRFVRCTSACHLCTRGRDARRRAGRRRSADEPTTNPQPEIRSGRLIMMQGMRTAQHPFHNVHNSTTHEPRHAAAHGLNGIYTAHMAMRMCTPRRMPPSCHHHAHPPSLKFTNFFSSHNLLLPLHSAPLFHCRSISTSLLVREPIGHKNV
mmetsp:Transcript_2855/g.9668  ORF Transcript_2855/g.9668 Transcript_2855/m.9668 type:complete len:207 (-) Transcript_2855:14-634(-)